MIFFTSPLFPAVTFTFFVYPNSSPPNSEYCIIKYNIYLKFLLRNAFPLSSSPTIILLEQESRPSPLLGWKRGRLEETRVGGKKLETKSSLSRSSDHGSHQFLPFANHPGFLLRLSEKTRNDLCVLPLLSREFFANFFEVAPPIFPKCPHAKGPCWGSACRRKTYKPENRSARPQKD